MKHHNSQRSSRISSTAQLVTCSGLAVTLIACNPTLNHKKLVTAIQEEFTNQTGIAVAAVTCPEDIKIQANDTFDCVIEAKDGSKITAQVVQKDDEGNIAWNTNEGLISLTTLEQSIQNGIQEQLKIKVKADCQGKFKIAYQGESFQCQVADNQGTKKTVNISVKDNQGNVNWELSDR